MSVAQEKAIQNTDNDALEAKAYAVSLGYWKDKYIKYFVNQTKPKTSEISRGYYTRTQSIESIVKLFMQSYENGQIISLGAGCDTLYFRLCDANLKPSKFVEIDLLENVIKKIRLYQQRKVFCDILNIKNTDNSLIEITNDNTGYYLLAFDMRSPPDQLWTDLIRKSALDSNLPTLILAECVFGYIDCDVVNQLMYHCRLQLTRSLILSYDLINIKDAFGKVMIQNLKTRNISLNGINACENKQAHIDRLKTAGYDTVNVWTIAEVYKSLPKETLKRIESLEMLDDPDMMHQLFHHYCFVIGYSNQLVENSDSMKTHNMSFNQLPDLLIHAK